MAYITCFFVLIAAVLVACGHKNQEAVKNCQNKNPTVTQDDFNEALETIYSNKGENVDLSEEMSSYFGCILQINGFINADNTINHEKLGAFRKEKGLPEDQQKFADECARNITETVLGKITLKLMNCGAMSGMLALLGQNRQRTN